MKAAWKESEECEILGMAMGRLADPQPTCPKCLASWFPDGVHGIALASCAIFTVPSLTELTDHAVYLSVLFPVG